MNGGIVSRTDRQTFRSWSSGNVEYGKDGKVEHSPQSPCAESVSTSSYMSAHEQSILNNSIMQEIQREEYTQIKAILHTVLAEIQEIKKVTNKQCNCSSNPNEVETPGKGVRRADTNLCSSTEQKGVLEETRKPYQGYEDLSKLKQRKERTQNIDNQIAESATPFNDSDREKRYRQPHGYDNVTECRGNSLQTRVKSIADCRLRSQSAVYSNTVSFDERECLANALQCHIEDLVDGIVFHESELPDGLLAEGCLTEDECTTVRKLRNRKDQIRVLVSLIKGRDFRVLKGFMKHINQHNPDVAKEITKKFEVNKCNGLRGKLCALCQLMKQFNVKSVADGLWAIQVINDELYNRIVYSEAPVGAQRELWKQVICSLNSLDKQNANAAQKRLITALSGKNLFTHIAEGIENMLIKSHGILTCACEPNFFPPKLTSSCGATTSGESVLPDSSSDSVSNDMASYDGTENGDIQDRRIDAIGGMSGISETTKDPTSSTANSSDVTTIYENHQENGSVVNVSQTCTATLHPVTNGDFIYTKHATKIPPPRKPSPPKTPQKLHLPPKRTKSSTVWYSS